MKIIYLSKFGKDLDKISSSSVKDKIHKIIISFESAESGYEINGLKKLKGDKISYRIRIGDYRLGIYIENEVITLARVVHRKDIYKVFP